MHYSILEIGRFSEVNIISRFSKTLVLGIGNPILRDDGVGPAVIKELQDIVLGPYVSLQSTNLAGFALVDMMAGFDYLIVVDSILSGRQLGEVIHLTPDDFKIGTGSFVSQHTFGILEAIELGKRLGMVKLSRVDIIAIGVKDVTNFSQDLTPEVAASIPLTVKKVQELLASIPTQV